MSGITNVRIALEGALKSITPALPTAWENWPFNPPKGEPYQRSILMPARPDNSEFQGQHYVEQGLYQITLLYPLQTGPALAEARVELIRQTFYRGASFTSESIVVSIENTPEMSSGREEGDRWSIPVRVQWRAQV